jgi:uroporphyrinogen-III synthase
MALLLRKHGCDATVVPSMREVPLEQNDEAFRFAADLLSGRIDVVVFLTGVGAQALLEVVVTRFDRERILAALGQCCVIARGPKPVAVLREWGTHIDFRAPEPNTWRELVAILDQENVPLAGRVVAVQEYGRPGEELYAALRSRGANVRPVPVYRWALPEDTGPLEEAIRCTVRGEFDLLLCTSANQITNVLEVAARLGLRDEWLAAANQCVIASIGPTASEALREAGLPPDLEPSHPRMGQLVREACEQARRLLAAKRAARA